MVGAMQIAGPRAPHKLTEHDNEKEEEDGDDFKEKNVAEAVEWPDKPAQPACKTTGTLSRRPPDCAALSLPANSWDGHWPSRRPIRNSLTASQSLTGHFSCYAHADAESPADGLRSHTDYDGSSDNRRLHFLSFPWIAVAVFLLRK